MISYRQRLRRAADVHDAFDALREWRRARFWSRICMASALLNLVSAAVNIYLGLHAKGLLL